MEEQRRKWKFFYLGKRNPVRERWGPGNPWRKSLVIDRLTRLDYGLRKKVLLYLPFNHLQEENWITYRLPPFKYMNMIFIKKNHDKIFSVK